MDASTRELVWRRAGRRCEYCRIHQEDEPFFRLHLEQGKTPMPVTIQLDDDLAGQLQRKAAEHRLSLEEFTARLLGGALGEIEVAEAWQGQNRRRVMLIRKSFANGLTPQEQAELQELQAALDQRLEPIDEQLLDRLHHLQDATADLSQNDKE